ncbi:MAG: trigger factor [Holosporales bacterium]|jgi:trigger factor|nr:trigger factor [Holosporales bacterium]
MQIDKKEHSSLSRTYTITITLSEITEKIDEWIVKKAATVKMDGFRKGKVPLDVVKKHYIDQAKPSVIEDILKKAQKDIIETDKLVLVRGPSFEIKSSALDEDFVVEMSVEIQPKVELIDHKEIHVEKVVCEVTQEEFDEAYSAFCKNFKVLTPTDQPIDVGDVVSLSYETFIGKSRLKKFCVDNASIRVGLTQNSFEREVGQIIMGMRVGEQKQEEITLSKDFSNKDLRNKTVTVNVTVLEVERSQNVEINDETAKKNSFNDAEDVKDFIWKRLRLMRQKQINICNKRAVLDALSEAYTFEIPPSLIEADFKNTWKIMQEDLERAREDDDEDVRGKTDEDLMQECRDISVRRIRAGFLLMEVFRSKNELPPAFIEEWLDQKYVTSEMLLYFAKRILISSKEMQDRLLPDIIEDYSIIQMLNGASTTERVLTPEELLALVQDTVSDNDFDGYNWRAMDIFSSSENWNDEDLEEILEEEILEEEHSENENSEEDSENESSENKCLEDKTLDDATIKEDAMNQLPTEQQTDCAKAE